MKTAKVETIIEAKEWAWSKYWPMFFIKMEMDNWETISICKKKSDAFKVGDIIKYEESTNENWKQIWKEVKENNIKKSTYNPEAANRGAMVWLAYKIAFEKAYTWEDSFNATIQLANRIFEEAMNTYNKEQKAEIKEEEKKDVIHPEDLPF